MSAKSVWLRNMRSVPFCNSFPARRGHYQTEKRYQTLRNILHLGRRLSSVPPSLPADNYSPPPAAQWTKCGTATGVLHGGCNNSNCTVGGDVVSTIINKTFIHNITFWKAAGYSQWISLIIILKSIIAKLTESFQVRGMQNGWCWCHTSKLLTFEHGYVYPACCLMRTL